jgi:hypothetical protein
LSTGLDRQLGREYKDAISFEIARGNQEQSFTGGSFSTRSFQQNDAFKRDVSICPLRQLFIGLCSHEHGKNRALFRVEA